MYPASISLTNHLRFLAQQIKDGLDGAAFNGASIRNPLGLTRSCQALVTEATSVAG